MMREAIYFIFMPFIFFFPFSFFLYLSISLSSHFEFAKMSTYISRASKKVNRLAHAHECVRCAMYSLHVYTLLFQFLRLYSENSMLFTCVQICMRYAIVIEWSETNIMCKIMSTGWALSRWRTHKKTTLLVLSRVICCFLSLKKKNVDDGGGCGRGDSDGKKTEVDSSLSTISRTVFHFPKYVHLRALMQAWELT